MGVRYPPAPMQRRKKGAGEEVDTSLDPVGITDLYSEERDRTPTVERNVLTLAQETSAMLQQNITQETASLAQCFPLSKFDQGLSMAEMETLVLAYARRGPDEKSELLHALCITPRRMASFFMVVPHSPSLPESDPVSHILGNQSEEEEQREKNRNILVGRITVNDSSLWARAMTTFESKSITTLGSLADTHPAELLSVTNFGEKQLKLCIELLWKYGLMTPEWNEAALEIRRRNGSSTRGKHTSERGK